MDQDRWFKIISNFTQLSGVGISNPQYFHFSVHGSHWNADTLGIIKYGHVHPYLIKAQDSIDNQPNDNCANGYMKNLYWHDKSGWDQMLGTTHSHLPHMNRVIGKVYAMFLQK